MNDEQMNESRMQGVEEALGRLRPAGLPESLRQRMEAGVAVRERMSPGDWVLAGWTGMGSAAAALIVGVIIWQSVTLTAPPTDSTADAATRRQVAAEVATLLAAR
jgi:hypothetical protein